MFGPCVTLRWTVLQQETKCCHNAVRQQHVCFVWRVEGHQKGNKPSSLNDTFVRAFQQRSMSPLQQQIKSVSWSAPSMVQISMSSGLDPLRPMSFEGGITVSSHFNLFDLREYSCNHDGKSETYSWSFSVFEPMMNAVVARLGICLSTHGDSWRCEVAISKSSSVAFLSGSSSYFLIRLQARRHECQTIHPSTMKVACGLSLWLFLSFLALITLRFFSCIVVVVVMIQT